MVRFYSILFMFWSVIFWAQCTESATAHAGDTNKTKTASSSPQVLTNSMGMSFVYIAPGSFIMGSPEDEHGRSNNEKQHHVSLTQGFYLQTMEVTLGQWRVLMGNLPSFSNQCGDLCPVDGVAWKDVQFFIGRLNKKERTDVYRLPTEAEWEYAARAGTTTPFAFGEGLSTDQANYNDASFFKRFFKDSYHENIAEVASFQPNAWGLYDMHGNISEWCSDWLGKYPEAGAVDPTGARRGSLRVLRGGCWFSNEEQVRSAHRNGLAPFFRRKGHGFRVARSLKENE